MKEQLVNPETVHSLADLSGKYGLGTVVALTVLLAFLVYIPIFFMYWKKKSKDEELTNTLKELANGVNILVKQYSNSISLDMANTLLTSLLTNCSYELMELVDDIIDKNDIIRTRDSIEARIMQKTDTVFQETRAKLSQFQFDRRCLGSFMDNSWKKEISSLTIKIIYNDSLTAEAKKRNTKQYYETAFANISFEFMNKLRTI